jgi:hypothetical protein
MNFTSNEGVTLTPRRVTARKLLAILLTAAITLSTLPLSAFAADNVPCRAFTGMSGDQAQFETRYVSGVTEITAGMTTLTSGWYVVRGYVLFNNNLEISGDVKLILTDGGYLGAYYRVVVNQGNSLTIYAQSDGDGMGRMWARGIGGAEHTGQSAGTITIHGGDISSTYNRGSAGIGGGAGMESGGVESPGGSGGTITIYGGDFDLIANGGAVIGGGDAGGAGHADASGGDGGNISIYGGTISTTVGGDSAAIGGGAGYNYSNTGGNGGVINI